MVVDDSVVPPSGVPEIVVATADSKTVVGETSTPVDATPAGGAASNSVDSDISPHADAITTSANTASNNTAFTRAETLTDRSWFPRSEPLGDNETLWYPPVRMGA